MTPVLGFAWRGTSADSKHAMLCSQRESNRQRRCAIHGVKKPFPVLFGLGIFCCWLTLTPSAILSTSIGSENASPDRGVAEWTILMGGSVRLAGEQQRIRELTDLPSRDFAIEMVDWVGANVVPPDLERLAKLKELKSLHLPGPMWNTRAGADKDYSRELRHLAALPKLEELTFSYTYLAGIKFNDDGLEEIVKLAPSLRGLSLENTSVRGRHLSAFTQLEHLDLMSCPVDDQGLEQLRQLKRLKILLLSDASISEAGLAHLSELHDLEHLDLAGTKVSDEGLAHLSNLRRPAQDQSARSSRIRQRHFGPGRHEGSRRTRFVWDKHLECEHCPTPRIIELASSRSSLYASDAGGC